MARLIFCADRAMVGGYGVACSGVHGVDEWVNLESMGLVTEVYAHAILDYCGDE